MSLLGLYGILYCAKEELVLADLGEEVAHLAGGDFLDATEGGEDARRLVGEEERLVGAVATDLLKRV